MAFVLLGFGIGVARFGSPQHIAIKAYDAFKAPPAGVDVAGNLNQRLFNLSSNGRLAYGRVAIDAYTAHPWAGSGAGTYEFSWLRHRDINGKVRDAHNLYLEVLSELGPFGLALLIVALGVPIIAATKVRRHPLVPIALGAYIAYLAHAAVDWDWEMPAVSLPALFCGVAILVVARTDSDRRMLSFRTRTIAVVAALGLATFAFIGLMGNLAIASSNSAASASKWQDSARHARDAKRWMPWSPDPWRQLGEAQYAEGNFAAARTNFRKAISKDRNNWLIWADLAASSTGAEFRAAAQEALRLNPLAPELAGFKQELKSGS
ncbi:hypothetical protein AYO48_03380 [Gaiella sp. SCGC AG-212-M14]|nr:hypothetical protein AYO48_03380 [Gaiella sp. SCGC AG-212-M14]